MLDNQSCLNPSKLSFGCGDFGSQLKLLKVNDQVRRLQTIIRDK